MPSSGDRLAVGHDDVPAAAELLHVLAKNLLRPGIADRFGQILADRKGFALYLFTRDQEEAPRGGAEESRCYGNCANAWPVLRKRGKLRAGAALFFFALAVARSSAPASLSAYGTN